MSTDEKLYGMTPERYCKVAEDRTQLLTGEELQNGWFRCICKDWELTNRNFPDGIECACRKRFDKEFRA